MKPWTAISAAALAAFALAVPHSVQAQSSAGQIQVENAWARLPAAGTDATTAYFEILNLGDADDRLLGATSPWAERAVITRYTLDGYKMKLSNRDSVRIKAKGRVKFSPSKSFIRLEKLTQSINHSMSIPITLRFEKAGQVEVQAKVSNQMLGNMSR